MNVNLKFNTFFVKVMAYFNEACPLKSVRSNQTNEKGWITIRIKISSARKRELHVFARNTSDPLFLKYWYIKSYKIIIRRCVRAARLKYNTDFISKSYNKIKAAWQIVRRVVYCLHISNELGEIVMIKLIKNLKT